jgi:hypothetical protein
MVNRLQMSRPWTPWWATDPSTAPPAQYEMTDSEIPVRRQTTRLLIGGKTRGYGTLLLYPDKLAAVGSGAVRIGTFVGAIVVGGPTLFIPPHSGPEALGALIGLGGGGLIGGAIAKSQAAAKVAAGGGTFAFLQLGTARKFAPTVPPDVPALSAYLLAFNSMTYRFGALQEPRNELSLEHRAPIGLFELPIALNVPIHDHPLRVICRIWWRASYRAGLDRAGRPRGALQVKKENGVTLGRPRSTPDDVVARVVREHTDGRTRTPSPAT